MTSRLLAVLIIFPIWLTLVLIFRKHRQWLLYYMVAAFGLTIQLVFLAEHFGFDQTLVNVASFHVSLISQYIFHLPVDLMSQGRFHLILPDGSSSILKLGIECSAVLESSIVVSLVLFYPLFNFSQKIIRALFALVVTYVINILRIMIIVLMAYKFGPDYIFLAHAGVARIFFFVCELLLYWYLMTKPTVKSVGVSIKEHVPLGVASSVGHAFQLRNALAQLIVIILVVGVSVGSFMANNEWKKTFVPVAHDERPIIYQEETDLTAAAPPVPEVSESTPQVAIKGASTASLNQQVTFDLAGNEKTSFKLDIQAADTLNVQVLEGSQDLAARLILNGESVELATMEPWLFNKEKSIFKPLTVKPGDVLELKLQNLTETPSGYLVKISSDGMENTSIAAPEPVAVAPPPQPQPTNSFPPSTPSPAKVSVLAQAHTLKDQVAKYTVGLITGLTDEIPTDILVIKKTAVLLARPFQALERKISDKFLELLIARQDRLPAPSAPSLPPVPETTQPLKAVAGASTGFNQEMSFDIVGNGKASFKFNIEQEEQLDIQVLEGSQDLAARLMLNGESVELVTLAPWLFNRQTSIFKPLTVKPGDVLELKLQNLTETPSGYLIKIFGSGGDSEQ